MLSALAELAQVQRGALVSLLGLFFALFDRLLFARLTIDLTLRGEAEEAQLFLSPAFGPQGASLTLTGRF